MPSDISHLGQRFITVEGIEGVGKSTNIAFISAWLEERGQRVTVTREPGGTPVPKQFAGLYWIPAVIKFLTRASCC